MRLNFPRTTPRRWCGRAHGESWSGGIGRERRAPVAARWYLPRHAGRRSDLHLPADAARQDGALLFTGPVRADQPVEAWRRRVVLLLTRARRRAWNKALLRASRSPRCRASRSSLPRSRASLHSRLADFASAYLRGELGGRASAADAAVRVKPAGKRPGRNPACRRRRRLRPQPSSSWRRFCDCHTGFTANPPGASRGTCVCRKAVESCPR